MSICLYVKGKNKSEKLSFLINILFFYYFGFVDREARETALNELQSFLFDLQDKMYQVRQTKIPKGLLAYFQITLYAKRTMPGFTSVTIKSLRVGLVLRYVCVNLSKPACLVFSCVQWCTLCAVETQHSAHTDLQLNTSGFR